jgi:single-stranded DNA-binding protein
MSTRGYNRRILVGNLIADPELRDTNTGMSFTIFRIAITRACELQRQIATTFACNSHSRYGKTKPFQL